MRVKALRQHRSTHGFHEPGDEYDERKNDAEAKIAKGIVEAVETKKELAAPENKKRSASREKKGE